MREQPLTLDWLPVPRDFGPQLRAALQIPEPAARLARLGALAEHDLSFLQTIQLDRALTRQSREPAPGYLSLRLAVLGSCTVDHLLPGIRVAGLRRRLLLDVYAGAYGQYRQELLQPPAALRDFAPQMVLLSTTVREALAAIPLTATAEEAADAVRSYVVEQRGFWRKIKEEFRATAVQQTFLDTTDPVFGSFDRNVPGAPAHVVAAINDSISGAAAADGVLLFDVARAAQRHGTRAWSDRSSWFQAKQEIAPRAAPLYGDLLARLIAAERGLAKKCLVLDLDNTLWHGVIGDDGIEGIVLGEGSPVGEAHADLQRYAKALKNRGIILAVCSKNDAAIADDAFANHPEMILERADIAAFVANWNDKAQNLEMIAAQLNIGLDSLVFVDDNPAERTRIRQALPMVGVPELPPDPADYARCLADAGYFESVGFTGDDTQRGLQYAANAQRDQLRGQLATLDEFLAELEMSVEFGPFAAADMPRVTQLINKTNQFNPTTQRYSTEEVWRVLAAPGTLTLQFRLFDRFGDNGLVSAMILKPDRDMPQALTIDTWVMSCRVFGRELEREAMNILIESVVQRSVATLRARYVPTAKNGTVSGLFETLGFTRIGDLTDPAGATEWIMRPEDYRPKTTRIARKPPRTMPPPAVAAEARGYGMREARRPVEDASPGGVP